MIASTVIASTVIASVVIASALTEPKLSFGYTKPITTTVARSFAELTCSRYVALTEGTNYDTMFFYKKGKS